MADATDHDQLFKTVIREFFPEFLKLFFPELAARFDLSAVKWLDKELFPNPPDGPQHVLDLVAELTTLGGDATTLALIHVEVESADSVTSIESRLPDYYHYLRRTKRKPVQPLVVYLKVGLDGLGTREIHDPPTGKPVVTYRYEYIGLPALPSMDYRQSENILGVTLSALMRVPKGGRVDAGVEAIRRITDANISDGRKALLGDCIETYIDLPEIELARFHGIIEANATGRVPPVNKTRVQIAEEKAMERGMARGMEKGMEQGLEKGMEQGLEKGMEQGLEKGMLHGIRAAVGELLEARFGPVPQELTDQVNAETNSETIRLWLRTAATAVDLSSFRAALGL